MGVFDKPRGLAVLLDNLNEMEEEEMHDEFEELYIKCMKSFMNNKVNQNYLSL